MNFNTSQFRTGDILLFHHEQDYDGYFNCVFSCLTEILDIFTQTRYSHAAIIIRDPDFTDSSLKGLYILEFSIELLPDAEKDKYKLNVELKEFDKVMSKTKEDESIYCRKLNYMALPRSTHTLYCITLPCNTPYSIAVHCIAVPYIT